MSQSIDFSNVTDATFNGTALDAINLNGTEIWAAISGPSGALQFVIDSPNSGSQAYFGASVAVNKAANKVVVATAGMIGSSWVFNATTGALEHSFSSPGSYNSSEVAISDTHIAIAYDAWGNINSSGIVQLYNLSGVLLHTFTSPRGGADAYAFGQGVALNSNAIAIGSPREDTSKGNLYVFNLAGYSLRHTLTASSRNNYERWGDDITLTENMLSCGNTASVADVPVNELSVFNPNTGARLMTLTPTNGEYNAGVITCTDDYVVKVSRAGTTNNVYIYNSTGALLSYTTYPNPSSYSNRNISMSGESILVGDGKNAFLLDITGNLVTTLSGNSTQYGVAVSIDENLMAVGQISNESTYQSEDVFVYN